MRKYLSNKKIGLYLIGAILLISFIFLAWISHVWLETEIASQLFAAIAGAIIAAIMTMLLLNKQSESEELKDRNMAVFNQKQDVYHHFLEELHKILQDGEITIGSKDKNGEIDTSVDELKDLIFQLSFLQLHTSEDTIKEVLDKLVDIIQALNDYNSSSEEYRQKNAPEFYSRFSNSLFCITAILRKDLYNEESKPIDENQMKSILQECDLYIERSNLDRVELQLYFWNELRKQLAAKGYDIKDSDKDFTQDINEYYARARNRYRWYGFDFMLSGITFRVEIDNHYYFGIKRPSENFQDEKICKTFEKMVGFIKTPWWYGWRHSASYDLDFWNLNSEGFKQLNNSRMRATYIGHIAEEIDAFAKNFLREYNKAANNSEINS